jgi:hypothetical protein
MANLVIKNNTGTASSITFDNNSGSDWKIINNGGIYTLNGKGSNLFTMTDAGVTDFVNKVTLTKNDANNAKFIAKNTDGSISLWTSSNRGVYDETLSKWIIYTDVGSTNKDTRIPSHLRVDTRLSVGGADNSSYKIIAYGPIRAQEGNIVSYSAAATERSIYVENNIKANESFHVGEDWQVSPLLLYHAKKIAYVNKVIYHYQLSRPNSITITSQQSVTKKKNQLICFVKTMNCLLDSFKDKGQTYLDVIYRKKAILAQDALIYCCKDRDKKSFNNIASELKSIDPKYLSVLGNSNPFVCRMKTNYYTLSVILNLKKLIHKY